VLWIGAAIVLALLVHFGLEWQRATAPVFVEYSTFLSYVESGCVGRVEITGGERIEGTYTTGVAQNGHVEVAAPSTDLLEGVATPPDAPS
jgi:cell division protease FtsH